MTDRISKLFVESDKKNKKITVNLNKQLIDTLWDGTKIYLIDGDKLRDNGNVEFDGGGNYYGDKDPQNPTPTDCPKNEIWIERMKNPKEQIFMLIHEVTEYLQMKYYHKKYPDAHHISNSIENAIRQMAKVVGVAH